MKSSWNLFGKSLLTAAIVGATLGSGELVAQDRVYDTWELTTQPSLRSAQRAAAAIDRSYPSRLRSENVAGTVQLSFVVQDNGRVDDETVEVVTTDAPRLGDAARDAVSRIQFNPGKVNGEAVASRVQLPIVYQARTQCRYSRC